MYAKPANWDPSKRSQLENNPLLCHTACPGVPRDRSEAELGHQPQNSLEFNPPAQPHPQRDLTSERILALERMPREEPNCPWGI
jgi:hypothetical protein